MCGSRTGSSCLIGRFGMSTPSKISFFFALMILLLQLLVFLGSNGSINLSILDNVIHVVIIGGRNIFEWKAVLNKARLFGGLISNCKFLIDCCKYCLVACSKD